MGVVSQYAPILLTIIVFVLPITINGQSYYNLHNYNNERNKTANVETVIFCTVSKGEQRKCLNFAQAVERDKIKYKYTTFQVQCKQAFNKEECMTLMDAETAHLTTLDPGQVFVAGRYHSLVPISQEVYEGGFKFYYSVAVVKKNSLRDVTSLNDLRGKKACFPEVGSYAGWVVPIHTLMQRGGMQTTDCNNHVKSAIEYFGPSCAINSVSEKYNPIGDNSYKLCQLCIGKIPGGKCTSADPYAGFQGAFRCLLEAGDIAFLSHTTVDAMTTNDDEFSGVSKDNFELLCQDGTRQPISNYQGCNWGKSPSQAVVTTSAASIDKRELYQKFLEKAAKLFYQSNSTRNDDNRNRNRYDDNRDQYDPNRDPYDPNRDQYDPNRNQYDPNRDQYDPNRSQYDPNRSQYDPNRNQYNNRFKRQSNDDRYFGNRNRDKNQFEIPTNRDYFNTRRNFEDESTTAQPNTTILYEKFDLFESAVSKYNFEHNLLFDDKTMDFFPIEEHKQTFSGYLDKALDIIMDVRRCPVQKMTYCVTSDVEYEKCVKMRTAMKAQLLKPDLVCINGKSHIQCMQNIKSGVADVTVLDAGDIYTAGLTYDLVPIMSEVYDIGPHYYVVAVSKEDDPSTDLTYLKGKNTCHTGINKAAGWVIPMAYLIANGWIRPYGCNSVRAAAEYFSKSCIPGALSTEYNTGLPYDNMCDLCHGQSYRYCRRDASEPYFSHTGAFRCLVEGGGQVAFVKHTTVAENTGGKRREWWARDALPDDFELLCPDGRRAEVTDYKRCNLGKVRANAVVARGGYGYNETEIAAYTNLFTYAQQFYGRKDNNEFSFSMFYSQPPHADLIFQDATQQLRIVEPEERHYARYLGPDFMRAQRLVQCNSGGGSFKFNPYSSIISYFIAAILALVFW